MIIEIKKTKQKSPPKNTFEFRHSCSIYFLLKKKLQLVNRNIMLFLYTWTGVWRECFGKDALPHTPTSHLSLSFSPSLSFFLPSNQPSGSVCKEERWPAVLCTRFDLSRFNPLWLPLPRHTPQPLHGLTFIHHSPLLSSLHPHTCPLHWQSSIIIFLVET